MYREFIDEFVLSPSMRQYLKTVDLSVEQITQLIYFSPVLLQQKKQAFYRLRDLAEKNQDEILKKEWSSRSAVLLPLSPLRTVHESFPSHGSSTYKPCVSRTSSSTFFE